MCFRCLTGSSCGVAFAAVHKVLSLLGGLEGRSSLLRGAVSTRPFRYGAAVQRRGWRRGCLSYRLGLARVTNGKITVVQATVLS